MSTGFVLLILMAGVAGCTASSMTAPVMSAQQECERSGGVWRMSVCDRGSGGGGY